MRAVVGGLVIVSESASFSIGAEQVVSQGRACVPGR